MGKKAKLKAIKRLAGSMALINEQSHEKHEMLGSEILAFGTISEIDGKAIVPTEKYIFNYPVLMIQNNARRMKRAFQRDGAAGIVHLLKQNLHTVQTSQNNQS
jgi:hypothetical protein